MANAPVPVPVKRTTSGLVDALFSTIDNLNNGSIEPEKARAISHTAQTIVKVATLELEFRKLTEGVNNKQQKGLGSLTIDAPPP